MTFLAACLLLLAAPGAHALGNRLKNHASPYLALHATDPVAWQEWGAEAVEQARREQKMIYVSVGYFACHWCHVMQRESYRNAEIAAFLNRHFIPAKVDRELESTLDAKLSEFAESLLGHSGWPLNVFVTPEGYPVHAVLYAPPAEFLAVLKRLQVLWAEDPAALRRLAEQAAKEETPPPARAADPGRYARMIVAGALSAADPIYGGFGDQSKFPSVPPLEFLLARDAQVAQPALRDFLRLTLDHMAKLGLRDHLGGGFFRYTIDPSWKTPHFEKMLYDNALLARLYLRAARAYGEPRYEAVARQTLDFMAADMRDSTGAFIGSLSAIDAEGLEGGYYLWQRETLAKLLTPDERTVFERAYGIDDAPPFEAGYLPMPAENDRTMAQRLGRAEHEVRGLRERAEAKLRKARASRALPRDSKRLAGWNGLALAAYAEAARTLAEPRYREIARGVRDHLMQALWDGKTLRRAVTNGRALGTVALEDYAYVALGLTEWAKLTGRNEDWAQAKRVAEAGWKRHHAAGGWRLGEGALLRVKEIEPMIADGPLPSPSAVLCAVSLELATETGDGELRRRAAAALERPAGLLADDPFWHATHVGALLAAKTR